MALCPEVSCCEEPGNTAALSSFFFGFVGGRKVMFASEEGKVTTHSDPRSWICDNVAQTTHKSLETVA